VPELFANCNSKHSHKWKRQIKKIAKQQDELTQLNGISYEQRQKAHQFGLFTIHDMIKTPKRSRQTESAINNVKYDSDEEDAEIDLILEKNLTNIGFKSDSKRIKTTANFIKQNIDGVKTLPKLSEQQKQQLKDFQQWLYLDFESTINGQIIWDMPNVTTTNYVYLTGIYRGFVDDYIHFNVKNCTPDQMLQGEQAMLLELLEFLELESNKDKKIVHWGNFEHQIMINLAKRYPDLADRIDKVVGRLFDLHKFFSDNSLIYPDMKDFSLKQATKSIIGNNYPTNCSSSTDCNFVFGNIQFRSSIDVTRDRQYHEILSYNRLDCQNMFHIIRWIINYHQR